ncbi:hypothetical protein AKO1_007420 [Acrasis kona]|uniref:Uncharacterized protein n=1 Tax=Acrasis kona TaxID=1008807 RepID=A0AAW2YHG7_9EUKA
MVVGVFVFEIKYHENYSENERFNVRMGCIRYLEEFQIRSWAVGGASMFFQLAVEARSYNDAEQAVISLVSDSPTLKEVHHRFYQKRELDEGIFSTIATVEILRDLFSNLPLWQGEVDIQQREADDQEMQLPDVVQALGGEEEGRRG